MLIDPAVNLVFEKMKAQLKDYKEKLEQAQSDLSAWKFTPDRLAIADSVCFRQGRPNYKRLLVTKLPGVKLCEETFLRNVLCACARLSDIFVCTYSTTNIGLLCTETLVWGHSGSNIIYQNKISFISVCGCVVYV